MTEKMLIILFSYLLVQGFEYWLKYHESQAYENIRT